MVLTKSGLHSTGAGIAFSVSPLSFRPCSYTCCTGSRKHVQRTLLCNILHHGKKRKKSSKWGQIIVPSLEKSPLKWKLFLASGSPAAERPAVKYCTAIQQRNLIRFSRDLEVGQNHIYHWLNLSLHSRGSLSRMRQVFKSISAFWCKLLWLVGCLTSLAAF